ncbi:MAG TPA: M48 family metallopeptidase [Thermoanaerobaculia bacterium]
MFRTLLAIGIFAVCVGAGSQPAHAAEGGSGTAAKSGDHRFEVKVTPEMRRHSRIIDTLYFVDTVFGFAMLAFVLASGLSRRLREWAQRIGRKRFIAAFVYYFLFAVVTTLIEFPLSYYGGFHVPHEFDLTSQSFASWMGDFGKEWGVNVLIGGFLVALAFLAIRKIKRWWIAVWIGTVVVSFVGIVLTPILFDPLFNKFEPLKDVSLRQALLQEASRAGIEGSRVYEVDKSKQTKEMNAYVTGLGPTNRIVMWDTLLQKLDRDEILAVMGHEMGHYVMKHIWQGFAWTVVISLFVSFLAQRFYERGLARWGRRWGVESNDDPAALPWLFMILGAIVFLISPISSGISRHMEHQADVFGLELTHLNDPMASAFVKFALDSKVDPTPNAFIEFWRYSHPSLTKRIQFVRNYKPWERVGAGS